MSNDAATQALDAARKSRKPSSAICFLKRISISVFWIEMV